MSNSEKKYVGVAPLTMIRTNAGGYASVYAGGQVPDDITEEDLKRLVDEGFLAEAEDAESDSTSDKVEDILAEVGDDKEKAAAALEAEQAKAKPRKTLVGPLEALLAKE